MVYGGGDISGVPALASADGRYIICTCASVVRVYSSVTGLLVQQLIGHTAALTGVVLHPHNLNQVLSASHDGTIRLWDLEDGLAVKSFNIGQPVHHLLAPHGLATLYFQIQKEKETDKSKWKPPALLRHFSLTLETLQEQSYKLNNLSPSTASPPGNVIAAADTRVVLVWSSAMPTQKPLKLPHTKNLSCVAVDAAEDRIAAGDVSGRILIWHGLKAAMSDRQAGRPLPTMACSTHHWHPHQVCSLSFSLDAAYLLSGGEEAVLVAWQLGSNAKKFLPRLSGKISGISSMQSDAARYVVTQQDNTIRIANLAAMKVDLSIHGLRKEPRPRTGQGEHAMSGAAAALLPGGSELVVAGGNAMLQFYDAVHDRHLDKLQVAPRSSISLTEEEEAAFGGIYGPPIEPQVSFVSFSSDGSMMATVDVRPDAGPGESSSASLKFWERRASGASASAAPLYAANTQVDDPHRGEVTGLAYHPTKHMVASTGSEGDLRIWVRFSAGNVPGGSSGWHWRCRSVVTYQGESMHSVAFSSDGSLIAAGTGECVVLWNAESLTLVAALSSPSLEDSNLSMLTFVPGLPYLAGAARNAVGLIVWNLLTATVWWEVPMPVTALGADSAETGALAVGFAPSGKPGSEMGSCVALFDAADPEPKQVWYLPSSWASALLFPPPSSSLYKAGLSVAPEDSAPLLIVTQDRRFAIGRSKGSLTAPGPAPSADEPTAGEQGSRYEAVLHQGQAESLPAHSGGQQKADIASGMQKVAALFDAPTHVLPPLSILAPAYLETLLHEESIPVACEL